MANFEVLSLDPTTPQIRAPGAGDGYSVPRDMTFATGTTLNAPTTVVSVNTSTDALRITQVGAGNALVVEDSANPDATPTVITATGDVGIGTTSPIHKLQVVNNAASTTNVAVINTSASSGAYTQFRVQGDAGQGYFGYAGSGNSASGVFDADCVYLASENTAAALCIGASGASAPIRFFAGGSNAGSERMRLDSSGNLGIGTTAPVNVLDLGSGTSGRGIAWGGSTGTANFNNIWGSQGGGRLTLATMLRGSTSVTNGYESSNAGNFAKSALEVDYGVIKFFTDAASAVPIGNAYTPTERMRIDASGRVGINYTPGTGDGILALKYNSASLYSTAGAWPGVADTTFAGSISYNASATTGAFAGNTFLVRNGTSVYQAAGMSAVSVAGSGRSPTLNFWAQNGASTFATVASVAAGSTIALEGATTQTGVGITFPATQVASANANSLDDYEEGTWTPTLIAGVFGTTDFTSVTYDPTRGGRYIKIGQVVIATFRVRTDAITVGSADGELAIGGLPFTVLNDGYKVSSGSVSESNTWAANKNPQAVLPDPNTTYVRLLLNPNTGSVALVPADVQTGANSNNVIGYAIYIAA